MKVILVGVLGLLAVSNALARDLPEPPTGFSWQRVPAIKGAFLRPDGWFFKEESHGTTTGVFLTKESIDAAGAFRTGFTLNCIRGIPAKKERARPSTPRLLLMKPPLPTHCLSARHFTEGHSKQSAGLGMLAMPMGNQALQSAIC